MVRLAKSGRLALDIDGRLSLRHYDSTGDYTFTLWLGPIESLLDVPDDQLDHLAELLDTWQATLADSFDARGEVLATYRRGVGL